ncbi:hypothetical protein Tco_1576806 [Tanacetum coccineum]
MAPKNSTILLNTRTSLKGLILASLAISHSLGKWQSKKVFPGVVRDLRAYSIPSYGVVIPAPTAILVVLQSITALAVARNPLPISKGVSGLSLCRLHRNHNSLVFPMYNRIMFAHDPKLAKVSKGFESPNLQGRVNSPRSSILADTSPWMNVDPFLPSSKLSTYLSNIAL